MANSVIYCRAFDLLEKTGGATLARVVKFYINEIFIKLLQKYPDSDEVRMQYFLFLQDIQKKTSQTLVEMRKIDKSSLSLHDQYLIYRTKFLTFSFLCGQHQ